MSRYAWRHPSFGQTLSRLDSGRLKLIRYLNCLIYLPAFIESYGGSTVRISSHQMNPILLAAPGRGIHQRILPCHAKHIVSEVEGSEALSCCTECPIETVTR
ncbi:hypothetical protein SAMN03159422_04784 [Agrobacterium fabrum]|nr:hypothetical protein SAMN03159422_04784 [Agrobacterium fabrum]SES13117.1 hypothetical protein SAMN03159504_04755 [Agrobacterium fabrum]